MKLTLRKSFGNWIAVGDNADTGEAIEFMLDYPTLEQQQTLDQMKYDYSNLRAVKQSLTADTITIDYYKYLEFKRKYIACTVKDWKGIAEKCEVVNGELSPVLLSALTRDESQVNALFEKINAALEFTESDKKK